MAEPDRSVALDPAARRARAEQTSLPAILLTGALLIGLTAFALWRTRPPEPRPADAPPEAFSAERAMRHVEAIAAEPHPTGSKANEEARRYLLDELRALGLEPRVDPHEVDHPGWGSAEGVTVHNIRARLPGQRGRSADSGPGTNEEASESDSPEEEPDAAEPVETGPGVKGPAVLLAAHYDSVPRAPGAADDAAAVAAILETLRALQHRPAPPNDVLVLLTDGEELGLLGARAFVEAHPELLDRIGVVLNFEARGTGGPSLMFETSLPNARLVRHFGEASPLPMTTSLATDVYRRLPNDTDFTVFREAGLSGLNFAFIEGASGYHTPLDAPAALSRASLRHHGAHMLGLAERFGRLGAEGFARMDRAEADNAVYFTLVPGRLVVYSQRWLWPLAAVLGMAFAATVTGALRWGRLSLRGWAAGTCVALGLLVVVPLTAGLLVSVLPLTYPDEASRFPAESQSVAYRWGLAGLAVAAQAGVLAAMRRRGIAPGALHLGFLGWSVVLAVVSSAALPGASYLFVWPALLGLGSWWSRAAAKPGWPGAVLRWGADAVLIAGVALLYVPVVTMIGTALGVRAAMTPTALLVLALGLLTPQIATLMGRRLWIVPGGLGLTGIGVLIAGTMAG